MYVGLTGLDPEQRFENHQRGIRSVSLMRRYGVRLMAELYAHLSPMPYEAAAQMECDLAEDLRREGYTVLAATEREGLMARLAGARPPGI